MSIFAHTYAHTSEASVREGAETTLVMFRADGKIQTVDSTEVPALANEDVAVSEAMSAVADHDDHCDVYRFGSYYGTAEYVDLSRPGSWFSDMQVVFSVPC